MRAVFSIASLLIVLAIVGMLAKKQLGGTAATTAPAHRPVIQDTGVNMPAVSPGATPQAQSLQIQQDVQQKLDASMQARPMPEADKP